MAYLLKLPQCCWLKLIASVLADFLQIDAKDFDVVLCEAKLDSANTLLRQCGVLKAFFHSSSQVHYHPWYFDQLHRRKHQPEDYQYFHFRHCYYVYQLCPPFWAETQKGLITFHFSKNMLSFSKHILDHLNVKYLDPTQNLFPRCSPKIQLQCLLMLLSIIGGYLVIIIFTIHFITITIIVAVINIMTMMIFTTRKRHHN